MDGPLVISSSAVEPQGAKRNSPHVIHGNGYQTLAPSSSAHRGNQNPRYESGAFHGIELESGNQHPSTTASCPADRELVRHSVEAVMARNMSRSSSREVTIRVPDFFL